MADVTAREPFKTRVTPRGIERDERLDHLAPVRQSRLSVMPVDATAWQLICRQGGVAP